MTDDSSLIRIIRRVVDSARRAGLDHAGQTQHAVSALMAVRPDMTEGEALALVERVRE